MSRDIDADAVCELFKQFKDAFADEEVKSAYIQTLTLIHTAPTIDIVFCKECKHNYNTAINHGKMQPRCDFADWKLTENDYCSRGERREP